MAADPCLTLTRLGGFATWAQLRDATSKKAVRRALAAGRVVRPARGRYALPTAQEGRAAAFRLTAVASHLSAAAHWGWATKHPARRPHVIVDRKRKIDAARRSQVVLRYRALSAGDVVDGWVTSPVRTVIDCCLDLPFDEALAVFDSSWRSGLKPKEVQRAACLLSVRQRNRVWAVASAADPRAANPFESVLRAIWLDIPALQIEAQHVVEQPGFWARVDLADPRLRIVLEADSFEFHGSRKAFDRDCRRYNGLVIRGWLVLRFTWEQVMFEPELVRATVLALVETRRRRRSRPTGTTVENSSKSA